MWDTIVAGLGVAGISGLVILAYRKPEEYRIIGSALFALLTLIGVFYAGAVFAMIMDSISALEIGLEMRPDTPIKEWGDIVSGMSGLVGRLKLLGILFFFMVLVYLSLRQLPKMRAAAAGVSRAYEVHDSEDSSADDGGAHGT